MSLREIPRREWRHYLEQLGREHRAWLASIERGDLLEVREEPLESISAGERIDIHIGGKAVRVNEPRAVRVEDTAEGATSAVQIDDAAGGRVTLRFRVAIAPGALDGIAPSER